MEVARLANFKAKTCQIWQWFRFFRQKVK